MRRNRRGQPGKTTSGGPIAGGGSGGGPIAGGGPSSAPVGRRQASGPEVWSALDDHGESQEEGEASSGGESGPEPMRERDGNVSYFDAKARPGKEQARGGTKGGERRARGGNEGDLAARMEAACAAVHEAAFGVRSATCSSRLKNSGPAQPQASQAHTAAGGHEGGRSSGHRGHGGSEREGGRQRQEEKGRLVAGDVITVHSPRQASLILDLLSSD